MTIDWLAGRHATDYAVDVSADGQRWESVYTVRAGNGGRDYLYLPETEPRYVRLRLRKRPDGRPIGIRAIAIEPVEWSASPHAFFRAVARDAPRGSYPRYLSDEQSY